MTLSIHFFLENQKLSAHQKGVPLERCASLMVRMDNSSFAIDHKLSKHFDLFYLEKTPKQKEWATLFLRSCILILCSGQSIYGTKWKFWAFIML